MAYSTAPAQGVFYVNFTYSTRVKKSTRFTSQGFTECFSFYGGKRMELNRVCKKCGFKKNINKFKVHTYNDDGTPRWIMRSCYTCTERMRKKNPKVAKYRKDYRKSNGEYFNKKHKEWRNKNKLQFAANMTWARFVKSSNTKRLPCAICGLDKTQAHHTDYEKPFLVVWLCLTHHRLADTGEIPIDNYRSNIIDYVAIG